MVSCLKPLRCIWPSLQVKIRNNVDEKVYKRVGSTKFWWQIRFTLWTHNLWSIKLNKSKWTFNNTILNTVDYKATYMYLILVHFKSSCYGNRPGNMLLFIKLSFTIQFILTSLRSPTLHWLRPPWTTWASIKYLETRYPRKNKKKTQQKYKEHVVLNISPDGGLGMCPLPPEAALPYIKQFQRNTNT